MSDRPLPEQPAGNSFRETLRIVGDTRKRLVHRELRSLSDIGRDAEPAFFELWRAIELARRREIMRAMIDLAEENVDIDFRDVFSACLSDVDGEVRAAAVEGLWDDDRPRTLRRLLALLAEDTDERVRAAAALGLGRFAYQASLDQLRERDVIKIRDALVGAARNPDLDPEVRRRALEGAGYFAGSDVDEAIANAYASGNVALKASALVAIGHSLDLRWLPILQAELGSAEPTLRYEAAHAAGEWAEQAEPLVPALLPLVESDDAAIYSTALWALGQIGGEAARRTLRRVARDQSGDRQAAAQEALSELDFDANPQRIV